MTDRARILHVVGSRPQFPKLAALRRALREHPDRVEERVVHSGQHYDRELSEVFFEELEIPLPDYNLGVGSGSHAHQIGATLKGVTGVIEDWRPDQVVVYGDTNATLAGALAATQCRVPVAHVEAGVRTGNLFQTEELNRVVTDRISTSRFCCTELNLRTLEGEALGDGSLFSGDTMLDNYRHFLARMDVGILERAGLRENAYVLCTVHRAENTDEDTRLAEVIDSIEAVQREIEQVVFPVHPRTRSAIGRIGRQGKLEAAGVKVIDSLGFQALQALVEHSRLVLSDSGGLQREAYFGGRRCVVPWEYASWPELVEAGAALPGPVDPASVLSRVNAALDASPLSAGPAGLFGDGHAGRRIAQRLLEALDAAP